MAVFRNNRDGFPSFAVMKQQFGDFGYYFSTVKTFYSVEEASRFVLSKSRGTYRIFGLNTEYIVKYELVEKDD